MKILTADQIRQWDAYTIAQEPIASIDLMERASLAFVQWFEEQFPENNQKVFVLAGTGNNGGDGLVIARLLHQRFYNVEVCLCQVGSKRSPDCEANFQRLPKGRDVPVFTLKKGEKLPDISCDILIDGLFGSGLNRPLSGYWASLVEAVNQAAFIRVAIDIPSGLFADTHTQSPSISADYTLSFQVPKKAFLFPENQDRCGHWVVRPIGLHPTFLQTIHGGDHFLDAKMCQAMLHQRSKYSHKGTFGHALLVVGSYGKIGAAVLAARACLRSGVGLLSLYAPRCGYDILQNSVPEAMVLPTTDAEFLTQPPAIERYRAVGAGCGIGTAEASAEMLKQVLQQARHPMVLDADALNILAKHPDYYSLLPPHSILTPHPKEFQRLFGPTANDFERHELQKAKAKALNVYILLKGANSCIATPEGDTYFNATGNPGMASGGSGDVLTGMLTALLAQGYPPKEAILLGVYLHGLAGDLAVEQVGSQEALLASDLIDYIGQAFKDIRNT
ncbi:MAG: NAD(P)H-hydrate dehydratase [Bacteroidota bacterium]